MSLTVSSAVAPISSLLCSSASLIPLSFCWDAKFVSSLGTNSHNLRAWYSPSNSWPSSVSSVYEFSSCSRTLCGSDHIGTSLCSQLIVLAMSLQCICMSCPFLNTTSPSPDSNIHLSNLILQSMACHMASEYLSRCCWALYAMCIWKSSGVGMDELTLEGVSLVLMMRLKWSSFWENLRAGRIHQLRVWIASLKWSGHVFGKSVQSIACHPSSPTSGVHKWANTYYSRILLVPSTRPLIQGKCAMTMWCQPPHSSQHCQTSLFLKCFPPSDMNTSAGANPLWMTWRLSCWSLPLWTWSPKCAVRYSPIVWWPSFLGGMER